MASVQTDLLVHDHDFHVHNPKAERRTRWVVVLTVVTMLVEIVAGQITGSMGLLADGWHMGTHAGALGIAVFAYAYARRHARNPRFAFGTGKVSTLGGYSSAVVLAVVALLMVVESARRFWSPVTIRFDEALVVAVIGLVVNLSCAWLLSVKTHHDHPGHAHDQGGHTHHHDHNLRAAYLHVVADALTSVLAIIALLAGRNLGWVWLDPAMGVVGGLVISRWSVLLLRDCGRILLDASATEKTVADVRRALEADGAARLVDLHVWRLGGAECAAILAVASSTPQSPEHYKGLLRHVHGLKHVTVEVHTLGPTEGGAV
jgi:cation diffusion facilitator family transporter